MIRSTIHLALHFLVPALAAGALYRHKFRTAWFIMAATMIIDLDHLLANPVFDPTRCSIGFHPLHSYYAIGVYCILLCIPKLRIVALGLLIHIGLDLIDCGCMLMLL
ncbi:MAG: hypothetical protein GY754_08120 [bacterium]|nr:hypothetical protein [bacterium]